MTTTLKKVEEAVERKRGGGGGGGDRWKKNRQYNFEEKNKSDSEFGVEEMERGGERGKGTVKDTRKEKKMKEKAEWAKAEE